MVRKPAPSEQTEHYIKQQVKKILTDTRWNWWMPSADIHGRNGVSDFLAVKPPKLFMVIETKYDDVATTLQLAFLGGIHAAGHYAFLVDETNVEELREILKYDMPRHSDEHMFKSLMKWRDQKDIFDIRISKT